MVLQKIILVKNLLILMETCWALLAVLAIATRLLFLSTLAQEIWHGSE
jgi:hypothetical protein